MKTRLFSVLLVVLVCLSFITPYSVLAEGYDMYCPNCGTIQLQGVITEHAYCPNCGCYLASFSTGGGETRGGGAGRIETAKEYYTEPSSGGTGNLYNGGSTNYYSIVDQTNNTLNYTTYNTVNNNYTYNTYNYTTYNYNNTYNYYTYNINNTYYYVQNYYTYVVISYPVSNDVSVSTTYENVILYYQLPDGRNSYDLTVSDVWGEYFIYDVVNYDLVAEDDGVTLALYHLDGDLKDSSSNNMPALTSNYTNFADSKFSQGFYVTYTNTVTSSNQVFSFPDELISKLSNCDEWTIEYMFKSSQSPNWIWGNINFGLSYFYTEQYNWMTFEYKDGKLYFYYNGTGVKFNNYSTYWSAYSAALRYERTDVSQYNGFASSVTGYGSDTIINVSSSNSSYSVVYTSGSNEFKDKAIWIATQCRVLNNQYILLDEIRVSSAALYDESGYTTSSQPFDTNLVLVLPENGIESQVAVKSNVDVSDIRVGGVRPTYPSNGDVYVYLEDNVVKDIQQYQSDGWYSVDASIYIDGSWISLSGYDMSDYGNDDEYDDGGSDPEATPSPSATPEPTLPPSTPETGDGDGDLDLSGLIDLIVSLLGGLVDLFTAVISSLISLFQSLLTMASGFSEFLTASFGYLPSDVLNVLGAGVVLMIILAVIKFIRG